jgi:hypothetical protein
MKRLPTWTQIKTLQKQQTSHVQGNTQLGLEAWNITALPTETEIPEHLQSRARSMIFGGPWHLQNTVI